MARQCPILYGYPIVVVILEKQRIWGMEAHEGVLRTSPCCAGLCRLVGWCGHV